MVKKGCCGLQADRWGRSSISIWQRVNRNGKRMKKAWQIMCISFVALSVFTIVLSLEYPYKDRLGPGPAFFPIWMSIITGALSLALFIQVTWGQGSFDAAATLFPDRQGSMRISVILIALLVCLALLDPMGFRISLFLFLLFLPLGLGVGNWWITLIFAAVGSFGVFHAFYYWLKVPLPIGMFGI
jgi:putative tricarboxylic transport membrane protein